VEKNGWKRMVKIVSLIHPDYKAVVKADGTEE